MVVNRTLYEGRAHLCCSKLWAYEWDPYVPAEEKPEHSGKCQIGADIWLIEEIGALKYGFELEESDSIFSG